jgi:hypothetical protein
MQLTFFPHCEDRVNLVSKFRFRTLLAIVLLPISKSWDGERKGGALSLVARTRTNRNYRRMHSHRQPAAS